MIQTWATYLGVTWANHIGGPRWKTHMKSTWSRREITSVVPVFRFQSVFISDVFGLNISSACMFCCEEHLGS